MNTQNPQNTHGWQANRNEGDVRSDDGRQLYRLGEVDDFEVADWEHDIRGWDVVNRTGTRLGTVRELIVDLDARKVRYLEVELELDKQTHAAADQHRVLLPIGTAELDEDGHHIVLGRIGEAELFGAPTYAGGAISRDDEWKLRQAYAPHETHRTDATGEFYQHEFYDVDRFRRRS